MTDATATLYGVTSFDGRAFLRGACRRMMNGAALGVGALVSVGVLAVTVTLAAAWIVNTAFATNPQIRAQMRPGALALGSRYPTLAGGAGFQGTGPVMAAAAAAGAEAASFAVKWARVTVPAGRQTRAVALLPEQPVARADKIAAPPHAVAAPRIAQAAEATQVAELTPAAAPVVAVSRAAPLPPKPAPAQADNVPLPPPRPKLALQKVVPPPAAEAKPQVAALAPPPPLPVEKHAALPPAHDKPVPPPEPGGRTAVYDIAAHTVYMPDGERLEAHSGLGDKIDDPRFVKVRMRGPTPPNVYDLTMREEIFHGVRAIRLNPVDDDKMYGRAGMLAHPYMLGPNGQSNGCVSFKDYPKFLHAFLKGEVDRLVVVASRAGEPPRTADMWRERARNYAFNNR